jgi:hypothetical protein
VANSRSVRKLACSIPGKNFKNAFSDLN